METTVKIGDMLETAVWMDGRETPAQRAAFEAQCRASIAEAEAAEHVVCGPIVWTEKKPGDDRVPPVPKHIQGPNVRLLVAETTVVTEWPSLKPNSFLGDLDPHDLMRLRQITRMAAFRHTGREITDAECDAIIEQIGPESAAKAVREAVDGGTVH